jgi:hypothetical protein
MKEGKCRSCGAVIVWARTVADRLMPLDAEPVADGNIVLVNGMAVSTANDDPAGQLHYKSHFATCPQSDQWRK